VIANLAIDHSDTELVTALGHVDKVLAKPRDAQRYLHTVAMAAKFETDQGKRDYRKRKWIAEPPNGWIKSVLGFRQLSMRGLQKTKAEFKLVCMAKSSRICLPTLQSEQTMQTTTRPKSLPGVLCDYSSAGPMCKKRD
jgi:hypothetical protein